MPEKLNRRKFIRTSAAGAAGASLFLSCEERALMEKPEKEVKEPPVTGLQTGKIAGLTVSKLVCGGNLISGYSHSRDLIYVSPLVKAYNTDEKILDTLELCEENGINTLIVDPREHPIKIIHKYWKERGGKMQWISEGHPSVDDVTTSLQVAIDNGAAAVYIQGASAEKLTWAGRVDLLGEAVEFIRSNGLPTGVGGHSLDPIIASEKEGFNPDFYMKTLNSKNYWSARHDEEHDNIWSKTPEETIEFMKSVDKPWIAFKTLAAGAIHPREAFRYCFENGADFVVAGMFDFQVREDAILAKNILSKKIERERPWRG